MVLSRFLNRQRDRFPLSFHWKLLMAIAVGIAPLSSLQSVAQSVTGHITGTVRDQSGGAVAGAMVTLTNPAQNTQTKSITDAQGIYAFPSVAVGRYNLKIEAGGFKPESRANLVIDINTALQLDIGLTVAEVAQELTVTGDASSAPVAVE